jgi:putative two-component system response regulator
MSKILIVDDTQDTRELLLHHFHNAGFATKFAEDGRAGFNLAIAEQPDVIITDVAMPNVDGYEMMRMLHTEPTTTKIPVVIFTAHKSVTPQAFKETGAVKIFYKPFDLDELVKNIRNLIQ